MIQRRVTGALLVLAAGLVVLMLVGPASPDAGAQDGCGDGFGDYEVSTAEELNAAIVCVNQSPAIDPDGVLLSYQITLLNDVEATSLAQGAVFEPVVSGANLDIEGNGFTVSRAESAPDDQLPLLSLTVLGEVNIFEMGLQLTLDEASGIDVHVGSIRLWAVGIEAPEGSVATGLVASENADEIGLRGSSIEGVAIGIVSDSLVSVRDSTIRSTGTDVLGPNTDFVLIDNSTLAGPVGIQMSDGPVLVQNSTVLGDGGAVGGGPNAFVTYKSSIVQSCSAPVLIAAQNPEPPNPPMAVVVDFETNAGGCFDASHVIDTTLSDNGCQVATPFGCARTVQLSASSPARGVGDCVDSFTDQRNVERTPMGPGCDAGAYEIDDCASADVTVFNAAQFDTAIQCFNAGDAGPGSYVITLGEDIATDNPAFGEVAVTASIDQPSAAFDLTIDGAGFELRADDPGVIDLGNTAAGNLIAIAPTNAAAVSFHNISLDSQSTDIDTLVRHQGSGALTATQSALGPLSRSPGIIDSSGAVILRNTIVGSAEGIMIEGGSLDVADSSFLNRSRGDDLGIIFDSDEPLTVINSTFDGSSIFFGIGATVTIQNSTFTANSFVNGGESNVTIISTLLNVCPDNAIDGGGNVGGCFGDTVDFGPSADNECVEPTPIGCAPTVALNLDSPALGAGVCNDITLDQRGEQRTPLGVGCDAGAFELPGFTPIAVGDIDADGKVDNLDVQALLTYLAGGDDPAGLAAADVNDDGQVRIDDALLLAQQVQAG